MAEQDPINKNERKLLPWLLKGPRVNWMWFVVLALLGTALSLYLISYLPDYLWQR